METLTEKEMEYALASMLGKYVRITRPRYQVEGMVLEIFNASTQMFHQIKMETHDGIALVPYHFRTDTYTIMTEEAYKAIHDFHKRIREGTVFTKPSDAE